MTPEDGKFIFQVVGNLGIGAVVGGAVVYFFLKTYLTSYLSEKGKNLATKEDIEHITRTVEEVKSELLVRHTLRFASLDKRLQAHQDAYAHARKLVLTISNQDNNEKALRECLDFLDKNAHCCPDVVEPKRCNWLI